MLQKVDPPLGTYRLLDLTLNQSINSLIAATLVSAGSEAWRLTSGSSVSGCARNLLSKVTVMPVVGRSTATISAAVTMGSSAGLRNLLLTKTSAVEPFKVVLTRHHFGTSESPSFETSCPCGMTARILFWLESGALLR